MDPDNPLVSIVVPAYNHAVLLKKAIQSVLNQVYTNWEIIVVDNHSTDDTEQVIMNFNDPRIRHIKIQNQGVIAVSRNAGIKAAKPASLKGMYVETVYLTTTMGPSIPVLISEV